MIIDYKLKPSQLPSERDVWLMSRRAELDGHTMSLALLKGMEKGEIKYVDGMFYRLCRHCMDYLPLDNFYANKRYTLNVNYICKTCTTTRRRIRSYGVAHFVTDVGMRDVPHNVSFSLSSDTKDLVINKMKEEGGTEGE